MSSGVWIRDGSVHTPMGLQSGYEVHVSPDGRWEIIENAADMGRVRLFSGRHPSDHSLDGARAAFQEWCDDSVPGQYEKWEWLRQGA